MTIVLQYDPHKQNHWLIASLGITKNIVVRGLIVKATEVKNMNGKDENIWVSFCVFEEGEGRKGVLKIQFTERGIGRDLIEKIRNVVENK